MPNPERREETRKRNEQEWLLAPGFKNSWKKYKSRDISDAMTTFDRCKRAIPPAQLPGKMNDHKLDGPLKGYMDCHLADDVILIYKPIANGAIKLFLLCEHADLQGPKAKSLAKRLAQE